MFKSRKTKHVRANREVDYKAHAVIWEVDDPPDDFMLIEISTTAIGIHWGKRGKTFTITKYNNWPKAKYFPP